MIVLPSPQYLVHASSPRFVSQISNHEPKTKIASADSSISKDNTMNFSYMFLIGQNPCIHKSRVYSSVVASDFLECKKPQNFLLMGSMSASANNFKSAIRWYKKAAAMNSVEAMNSLGLIFMKTKITDKYNDEKPLETALRWFSRAYRLGSIRSLQYIAQIHLLLNNKAKSLALYNRHLTYTNSLKSQYSMGSLLKSFGLPKTSIVWYVSCVACGHLKSMNKIIKIVENNPTAEKINGINMDIQNLHFDLEDNTDSNRNKGKFDYPQTPINSRNISPKIKSFNSLQIYANNSFNYTSNDPPNNPANNPANNSDKKSLLFTDPFHIDSDEINKLIVYFSTENIFKLNFQKTDLKTSEDFQLPSFTQASDILWLIDPLSNSTQHALQHQSSLEFFDSSFRINPKELSKDNKSNYYQTKPKVRYPFFPSASKSQLIMLAFKHASPVYKKRNLYLTYLFIQKMQHIHSRGITESCIFRNRCQTGSAKQLVQCGFVSFLCYDPRYALNLFQRAGKLGNMTGSLMAGLMYFHGIGSTLQMKKGCYFLSQCTTDPIALLHLSLACKDEDYENRASEILGTRSKTAMYSWIADLFANGVKLPANIPGALMLYGVALNMAEANGEDILDLFAKMSKLSKESCDS